MSSNIAIIGAGKLGARIAEGIVCAGAFDELYLANRSPGRLESIILSLRVLSSIVGRSTRIARLSTNNIAKIDLVVLVLKDAYDPRDLLNEESLPRWFPRDVRTIGFKRDLPLIRSACRQLDGYVGTVVVISNPVDIMTTLVKAWLPSARVFGLGVSLDAARLAYELRGKGIHINGGHECLVGGEHGKCLVLLHSLWRGAARRLSPHGDVVKSALLATCHIGPAIVKGLGYTLHDCAAVFLRDIQMLAKRSPSPTMTCVAIGDGDASIGRPVLISGGIQNASRPVKLPHNESQALDAAQAKIGSLVKKIRSAREFADIIS